MDYAIPILLTAALYLCHRAGFLKRERLRKLFYESWPAPPRQRDVPREIVILPAGSEETMASVLAEGHRKAIRRRRDDPPLAWPAGTLPEAAPGPFFRERLVWSIPEVHDEPPLGILRPLPREVESNASLN